MVAGAGVALTLAASAAQAGSSPGEATAPVQRTPSAVRTYVVRPGDTLWVIAERLVGSREDPRPIVDELARTNALHGELEVGTRLVLPG
jgi:Tfp pilus assembly protein FimV